MQKYVCEPCGYVYDPEIGDPDSGIEPGTAFEDIPEDWVCPICGVGKDEFVPEDEVTGRKGAESRLLLTPFFLYMDVSAEKRKTFAEEYKEF